MGANTIRACSDDTYLDCPCYEQDHWVGDARNEALIDWVVNGDPRLWFRCLIQEGRSLERSPMVEGQVPGYWQSILVAWTLLWMRSCAEYLTYTADKNGALQLLGFLEQNAKGLAKFINADNLLDIRAWSIVDWALMDTPHRGVITHQNMLAVLALEETACMAESLGRPDLGKEWRRLAKNMREAINLHLWNDRALAYTDCLREGIHSTVFSQQTQTFAYLSDIAEDGRSRRCLELMHNPPDEYIHSGSPFFDFFIMEAMQKEGNTQAMLEMIRKKWGFMADNGSIACWEHWPQGPDRFARSYSHGWSAGPTFFLSTHVLGVTPGGTGFNPLIIEPHPGDLTWARGVVPTPYGNVDVQWENDPTQPFSLRVKAPSDLKVEIRLPRSGTAICNGKTVSTD